MKAILLTVAVLLSFNAIAVCANPAAAKAKTKAHAKPAAAVVAPSNSSPAAKLAIADLKQMSAVLKASTGITYTSTVNVSGGMSPTGPINVNCQATIEKPNKAIITLSPIAKGQEQIFDDGTNVTVFNSTSSTYATAPAAKSLELSMMSVFRAIQTVYPTAQDALGSYTWMIMFPSQYNEGGFYAPNLPAGISISSGISISYWAHPAVKDGKPVDVVSKNFKMAKYPISFSVVYTIDKATGLPVVFDMTGSSTAGKSLFAIHQTFSNVTLLTAPQTAATYTFTPPAGATLVAIAPTSAPGGAAPPSKLLAAGTVAPDFSVNSATGTPVKLSSFAGKIVVVDFWATWCGPCQASLPHTDAIAKAYQPKGVVFLPICSWDDRSAFSTWVKAHKSFVMPFYYDTAGQNGDSSVASKLYGVDGIPTQYVIGKDGKVITSFVGYDSDGDPKETALSTVLDKALAGP